MELKEGVENHLINCIKEHDKRRHSSVDEDKVGKLVKFYDYVPDGAISRLITEIITSIIRVVIEQLAASVEFRKH